MKMPFPESHLPNQTRGPKLVSALVGFAVLLSPVVAWGNAPRPQISGVVKDLDGRSVPRAKVTLVNTVNTGTKAAKIAMTGDDGAFAFPDIEPGVYNLTVTSPGFRPGVRTGLVIDSKGVLALDIILVAGPSTNPGLTSPAASGSGFPASEGLKPQTPDQNAQTGSDTTSNGAKDGDSSPETLTTMFPHPDSTRYWISAQANIILQWHGNFPAKYSGPNSLDPHAENATSHLFTLYTGYELSKRTEV
ncbi:MAG TPA: carboxypeptidase-like regulatory domain-containing protein, partial [Blastocatellia bacterium]